MDSLLTLLQERVPLSMQVFSFKRLKEERLRLQDEMDRGYFEDFKDLKKNQGKVRKHLSCHFIEQINHQDQNSKRKSRKLNDLFVVSRLEESAKRTALHSAFFLTAKLVSCPAHTSSGTT
jgi:hypothetical protein